MMICVSACGHSSHEGSGAQYLRAANKANADVAVAKIMWSTDTVDLDRIKAGLQAIAGVKERFDVTLRGLPASQSVGADLTALITADVKLERALQGAAAAPTIEQLVSLEPAILAAGATEVAAANAVRKDLGLPPVP
jgi:hypothetical protein